MTSYMEHSPILKSPQDFPAGHLAGHFEHVAQMNMYEDTPTLLRILPKICLVKIPTEDDTEPSGLGDKNFKVPDPADSASLKNGHCCKLLDIVKQDLQPSDSEDCESKKTSPSSKKTSRKKREDSKEKKKDHGNEDSAEWAKARKKVEEFLDFPALISAMNFRNKTGSSTFSQISSMPSSEQLACRKAAPIPNTRHNAVFLRDNPKAVQVIMTSPYHNGDLSKKDKRDRNEELKGNPPLKEVLNLNENSNMEAGTEADR